MIESDTLFILLEFIYLLIFLGFIFTKLNFLVWIAYVLAGFKYSISSIYSIDIITYQKIYRDISTFGSEAIYNQEGIFLNLLYIAKLLHIPLTAFHAIEIVIYLLSVSFLYRAFVPKYQAIAISLVYGFFPVGGELCYYLLRQLLSTSFVFIGMGFLFRDKFVKGLLIFSFSILFHSSAIIYLPLFVIKIIKNNALKIILISLAYGVYIILIYNNELGSYVISSVAGKSSIYYSRYQTYTSAYSQPRVEGWREAKVGIITAFMFLYFVSLSIWKINFIKKTKLWLYYSFTFIFTLFYIILSELELFWAASRFNFISDILLLTSNIFLTMQLFPKSNYKIMFSTLSVAIFWLSVVIIIKGYEVNDTFKFSF